MSPLPATLQGLLDEALVSLAAWHVLEGLCRLPAHRGSLSRLVATTGLDVTQASGAVGVLCDRGLLRTGADGDVGFAPACEAGLVALCSLVEADRGLQRRVVREAARRDALELRISWAPGSANDPAPSETT